MKLHKQVYIYFSSYFINAALSFVTVSLLTHYLSTYDYGIINLYNSFLIFLMPFVTGGILYPLSVEYFKRQRETYSAYFTDAQAIPLVSVVLFTILCIAFQHPLSRFLKVSEIWIWIMPLTAWWVMINETTLIITRNKNRPVQFAFFSIGKNLAEISLTITLVPAIEVGNGKVAAASVSSARLVPKAETMAGTSARRQAPSAPSSNVDRRRRLHSAAIFSCRRSRQQAAIQRRNAALMCTGSLQLQL